MLDADEVHRSSLPIGIGTLENSLGFGRSAPKERCWMAMSIVYRGDDGGSNSGLAWAQALRVPAVSTSS